MKADDRFLKQPKDFWATVRTISQEIGYTNRKDKTILVPTIGNVRAAFFKLNLSMKRIEDSNGKLTPFGECLFDYYEYRADILNNFVKNQLMNREEAEKLFMEVRKDNSFQCPLPMNKQSGDKKNYAFLTGMVNMLIESNIGNLPCNYDPRSLTTITHDSMPLRTLSRRVDGAFPAVINPVAIWEIKEYYYTKTFGSRVADGVYESLLDGMEIEELEEAGHARIQHVLIVDDYFTWWSCGRSYLCRIIDMLHMGYLDEVIFGKEVVDRMPVLVEQWKRMLSERSANNFEPKS
ncbi:hypothetical protein [Pseudomonas sp. DE0010]|uniref:DUF7687 domain-containing protein n=1 Tax=Pseudomonas sp. DE0010 TaxID=2584951 RepID=UPI0011A029AF|nr:hypothetical protein [Pseudomonas sp. DE0010]